MGIVRTMTCFTLFSGAVYYMWEYAAKFDLTVNDIEMGDF